tara:strand:+ start:1140 stop:1502 length:363 start_codon:yes stop_codon:yes gene_type:complete
MAGRFIDKLKKAARLDPIKKEITLEGGETVVMWVTPLTAAERERAKKDARSDDPNAFALQLLVRKAKDSNGTPLFGPGDVADLKNAVRDSDLQSLMLAVLGGSEEDDEALDMKSSDDGAE